MLSELKQVRWDSFAQPSENAPDAVPSALRALADTAEPNDFTSYNRLLFAMGNNHAGTYFPVVLPTIPFLVEILSQGRLAGRLRALDVLIDLVGSFQPEQGFEQVATPQGQRPLRRLLVETVREQVAEIEKCRANAESAEEARLAEEVLSLLQD